MATRFVSHSRAGALVALNDIDAARCQTAAQQINNTLKAAALYLASPEARHVSGQTLVIDGGWSMQSPLPPEHPVLPTGSFSTKE